MLGDGDYSLVFGDWRAGRMFWQTPESATVSVSWGRELSAMSKASATVQAPAWVIDGVEPWVHTLSIYRSGLLVWHGVVVTVTASGGQIRIDAADGAKFFARRRVPSQRTWMQHDATQVMRTHVEDGLGFMDACGVVENMQTHESRIWINASYSPAECMVDDVVDDLVEQGLVWTISGGTLIIGPLVAGYRTAMLQDKDLSGEFTVVKDGEDVVTDCHVQGKGVFGQYREDSPAGLVQSIEKADGAVRAEECRQQAERMVKDSAVAPRRVVVPSGAQVMPTAPVTIQELVPGVTVPVASAASGVNVASPMCLKSVQVSAGSSGESVKVTLSETPVTFEVTSMPDPALIDLRSPYEREADEKASNGVGSGDKKEEQEVGVPPS